jgi:hypothetical protein
VRIEARDEVGVRGGSGGMECDGEEEEREGDGEFSGSVYEG